MNERIKEVLLELFDGVIMCAPIILLVLLFFLL